MTPNEPVDDVQLRPRTRRRRRTRDGREELDVRFAGSSLEPMDCEDASSVQRHDRRRADVPRDGRAARPREGVGTACVAGAAHAAWRRYNDKHMHMTSTPTPLSPAVRQFLAVSAGFLLGAAGTCAVQARLGARVVLDVRASASAAVSVATVIERPTARA